MCYSLRPSRADPAAVNPCAFGLSPKFSTPVEKTVENRALGHEPVGSRPGPDRNKGEPAQFLYVVPTHVVFSRRSDLGNRPGPQCTFQGLAHQALFRRNC